MVAITSDAACPMPQMTGRDVAAWIGFSDAWLWKLEQQGYVRRLPNRLFDAGDVARGYIAFLTDAERRAAKTEGRRTLIEAQVEKLRLENEKQLDSLVPTDLVEKTGMEILQTIREEFRFVSRGLPADTAADLDKRYADAFNRCEKNLQKHFAQLRGGPRAFIDDEE